MFPVVVVNGLGWLTEKKNMEPEIRLHLHTESGFPSVVQKRKEKNRKHQRVGMKKKKKEKHSPEPPVSRALAAPA